MPTIWVAIGYDEPDTPYWLNPDNVKLALEAYCPNTKFITSWVEGGDPWKIETKKEIK